jgi:5-(aminomethyl)-3-furanmethanol phosphate kinase
VIDLIVKIGGGMMAAVDDLDAVLRAVAALSRTRRVVVVAGGGIFADAVRELDRRIGLPDEAAHWMAILAMDQYAHFLTTRLPLAVVVATLDEAGFALDHGRLPVLAPSRWLKESDPLPHSWSVTSDSIAAWVAGQANARDLVLVKPRRAAGDLVDSYFARAVPPHITPVIVTADRAPIVLTQLAGAGHPATDIP